MAEPINKDFIDQGHGTDEPQGKRIQITPEEEPELRKSVFDSLKNKKPDQVIDIGETVLCDQCNKDYTNSEESGGFIFGSHAYCPKCAEESLPRIKSYNEQDYIKCYCPAGQSFKDFVLEDRGGNNTITITTLDEPEKKGIHPDLIIQDEFPKSICRFCGNEVKEFKDAVSKKEFGITGMCQKCQDEFFD